MVIAVAVVKVSQAGVLTLWDWADATSLLKVGWRVERVGVVGAGLAKGALMSCLSAGESLDMLAADDCDCACACACDFDDEGDGDVDVNLGGDGGVCLELLGCACNGLCACRLVADVNEAPAMFWFLDDVSTLGLCLW